MSLSGLGLRNWENDHLSGEAHFLENYLRGREHGVVFDVGANVGDYARKVMALNPRLQVHAFEPHPLTYSKLKQASAAGQFTAVHAAVGEREETLTLHDYANQDGSEHASLYKSVIEDIHHGQVVSHQVGVIPLSGYVREQGIGHISLLKIDTEGHELAVLLGLPGHLAAGRVEAVQFEFNEMNVVSRVFLKDFFTLLPEYVFFRLLPRGMLKLETYNPLFCEIFTYQNIVAIHRDSSFLKNL